MSEKKDIYRIDINGMRELLREFSKTLYGRTVFFLAYFLPAMAFLTMIGLVVAIFITSLDLFYPVLGTFFIFIGLFVFGNAYYYHELRVFANSRFK